jgi:hypothetical protein
LRVEGWYRGELLTGAARAVRQAGGEVVQLP